MNNADLFYFDNEINLDKLRYAQLELGYKKVYECGSYFNKYRKSETRYLFDYVGIVGSGKTLVIPTIAFAFNNFLREKNGIHCDRIKHVLVLSKESGLRSQLYLDISTGLVDKGICKIEPKCREIEDGSILENPNILGQYDIVFACIQQLFEKKSGRTNEELSTILNRFQLIFVDEPQWAADQVNSIVNTAKQSIVFGLTGSPLDEFGVILNNHIMFSCCDYNKANAHDKSLKYLPNNIDDCLEVLDIVEADMKRGDTNYVVNNTKAEGYQLGLAPVMSVCEKVIDTLKFCDVAGPQQQKDKTYAPHRLEYKDVIRDCFFYPSHAIIVIENRKIAQQIQKTLNSKFENDRQQFPMEDGWKASIAISGDYNEGGGKIPELDSNHEWMIAKFNDGKFCKTIKKKTVYGSRILLLVGKGREGLDNVYCNCVGIACNKTSLLEIIQRAFGRQLRAAYKKINDGYAFPPQCLDSVKIITHNAFFDCALYESGHQYLLNMMVHLEGMPSIEQLIDGNEIDNQATIEIDSLSHLDRIAILDKLCHTKNVEPENIEEVKKLLTASFASGNPKKEAKVKQWIDLVEKQPRVALSKVGLNTYLEPIPTVIKESLKPSENPTIVLQWLQALHPDLYKQDFESEIKLKFASAMYSQHMDRFKLPRNLSITNIDDIRTELEGRLFQSLYQLNKTCEWGLWNDPKEGSKMRGMVCTFVAAAVKQIIGTNGPVNKGGEFDTPQYHAIFTRPHVSKDIVGFVVANLAKKCIIPNLGNIIDEVNDHALKGKRTTEPFDDDDVLFNFGANF